VFFDDEEAAWLFESYPEARGLSWRMLGTLLLRGDAASAAPCGDRGGRSGAGARAGVA